MLAVIDGAATLNDVQTMAQVFFPNEGFELLEAVTAEGRCLRVAVTGRCCEAALYEGGSMMGEVALESDAGDAAEQRRCLKRVIYQCLSAFTGLRPPWGILTGIRPAKLLNELMSRGMDDGEGCRRLMDDYLVTEPKAELCRRVALAERALLAGSPANSASLYIGIPFCPTRCIYCSFASYPIKTHGQYMDAYIDALINELEFLSPVLKGYYLENIYIGGGTPSALDSRGLERLLAAASRLFDVEGAREYCVEAGRPDSLDAEKLGIIRRYGTTRLSVNPQTMNDGSLRRIGREHTAADFIQGYELARSAGFDNINADVILGLPGESPGDVAYTFSELGRLAPENITVHTLAVKRASRLKEELADFQMAGANLIEEMLAIAAVACGAMGMSPYYMYRQKNMVGGFENVGWSLPGRECLYNIQIMEERRNVFAAGAGAVTKLVDPVTNHIERAFNVKSLEDYIGRTDEMLGRKKSLFDKFGIAWEEHA